MPEDAPPLQLHEQLRRLLGAAHAESCQVVATFLDIRGFSTFAASGESFDAAVYLRSAFSRILSDYFPDSDYFKPTGDGLMLIHCVPVDQTDAVPTMVSSILEKATELVDDFGELTADDFMVNFPVPALLGVGIARGSATRLVSAGHVLDYTGRCLNLAARLMDKARPHGVVFHDRHAEQLMSPDIAQLFTPDRVCIRGISDETPIPIHVSSGVEIRPSDREAPPASSYRWGVAQELSLKDVRSSSGHGFYLPRHPYSYETAQVHVQWDVFDEKGKRTGSVRSLTVLGVLDESPHGTLIRIPI